MPQRAAKSIELSDHKRIARSQLVEDLVQLRALIENATGLVDEHPIAPGRLQRVEPQLMFLVGGGDAGVAEQVAHAWTVQNSSIPNIMRC
jgi:hypothetical protein